MSDYKTVDPIEVICLLPKEIQTDSKFNVRPFSSEPSDAEDKFIEELAASLEANGQLDHVIVTPEHVLIAGHRRRKAAMVVNERRSARGESLFRLTCTVDRSGGDLVRKAIVSNVHRKDVSAMDRAYLAHRLRERYGWHGYEGTKRLAAYLGVSPATVAEHDKFLTLPREIQEQLHLGRITSQIALELLKTVKDKPSQIEVIQRATEIQQETQLTRVLEEHAHGRTSMAKATQKVKNVPQTKIQIPAVRQAITEVACTRAPSPKPLRLPELLATIAHLDSDSHSDLHRAFVQYLIHEVATGTGNVDELHRRFEAIVPERRSASRAG